MSKEIKQDGSNNIAVQSENSTVNITQVIVNNADYEKSKKDLEREKKYLALLGENEIEERLDTSKRINDLDITSLQ